MALMCTSILHKKFEDWQLHQHNTANKHVWDNQQAFERLSIGIQTKTNKANQSKAKQPWTDQKTRGSEMQQISFSKFTIHN